MGICACVCVCVLRGWCVKTEQNQSGRASGDSSYWEEQSQRWAPVDKCWPWITKKKNHRKIKRIIKVWSNHMKRVFLLLYLSCRPYSTSYHPAHIHSSLISPSRSSRPSPLWAPQWATKQKTTTGSNTDPFTASLTASLCSATVQQARRKREREWVFWKRLYSCWVGAVVEEWKLYQELEDAEWRREPMRAGGLQCGLNSSTSLLSTFLSHPHFLSLIHNQKVCHK